VPSGNVGPVFHGALGHHLYLVEFAGPRRTWARSARALDAESRGATADYLAHRAPESPAAAACREPPGGRVVDARAGQVGGQTSPRMTTRHLTSARPRIYGRTGSRAEMPAGEGFR